jgi:predicted TPR repeat methyltransferase
MVRDWMSWIIDSRDRSELQEKYDAWAAIYEADVHEPWLRITSNLAQVLQRVLPNKSARLLDAGAGTGLLGQALSRCGYTDITAADLSAEMLKKARAKQVYASLIRCNLDIPQEFGEDAAFDGIVASGVFAAGHAGVSLLRNLFRILKPGGVFAITIRESYYRELRPAFDALAWQLIAQEKHSAFDSECMHILALRKSAD